MKIIAFITNPYVAKQILAHLKLGTDPFEALPLETKEWENDSQIAEWENRPDINKLASRDKFERDFEISQLVPGTIDGFSDSYDTPFWMDSS